MADITISLPNDRMLNIDKIHPKDFLETWDALMGSGVINSLLGDEKKHECQCYLSGARVKELAREGVSAAGLVVEAEEDDNDELEDFWADIEGLFAVYSPLIAVDVFNEAAERTISNDSKHDLKSAPYFAAKIATYFMWKQMKDNYVIGLKNNEIEKDDD